MKKYYSIIKAFICFIAIQCILYFGTKLLQGEPHLIHSIYDAKIPYVSWFAIFYYIWYIFLFGVPLILYVKKDRIKLNRLFISLLLAIIIADTFFVIYPSTVIRADLGTGLFDFIVSIVYFFDNPPVNCLPSLHCLFSFLFIFATFRNKNVSKGIQIITFVTCLLICASTLLIKQHALLDLLTAFPVAIIVWTLSKYIKFDYMKLFEKKKLN